MYDTRPTGTQTDLKIAEVDKEERSMLRCISLVREGHVGRAAKTLCQSGFLNPTDLKFPPILKQMNPKARHPTPPLPVNAPYTPVTNSRNLRKFLRQQICKEQAPGPSG